jgi:metallo-beta-lactamase superfamily protein
VSNLLHWHVFVSTQIPVVTSDLPPGVAERRWSPISSTLISGERDAVLVDTFITVEQNRALVEWIEASGKNLTTIYATHGHGDHFFGVNTIRERFPNARFVATRDVITIMREQASSPVLESFWKSRFPGQIDSTLVIAEELAGTVIELEGGKLVSIPLGIPIRTVRLAFTSLRSAWSWQATLCTTMFMSTWQSQTPIQGRSGSLRSIPSNH